jgi:protein-tyrosine-phosphatase
MMKGRNVDEKRTVLFVCPHGAAKSRMAAAFFNRIAPGTWQATSAGVTPQEAVSLNAIRLLRGGDAEAHLDLSPPQSVAAVHAPDRIVAIDCAVPHAERWNLLHQAFEEPMRDELRSRAEALAREVGDG